MIADVIDRLRDERRTDVPAVVHNRGARGLEVDRDAGHAADEPDRVLDVANARTAAHDFDREIDACVGIVCNRTNLMFILMFSSVC